ncbi:hypothetical protein Tco_0073031 [Tanacetum coccineum]
MARQLRPKNMSLAVEETPNADGSICNTVDGEEGIPRDFTTSSVMLSAMRKFCESTMHRYFRSWQKKRIIKRSKERRGRSRRSPSQASSRSASVFSRLEAKGKKNEGKMRKNSYEAMSLVLANVNEKMNGNTEGAKGPTQKDEGEDLSEPYDEESTTPFTRSINKFVFPKRIRMPSTVKTYDGTSDLEDHLKTFTTAAKVER